MPAKSAGVALKPKQQLFVERYLIHRNAAKAAREAGYSKKNADRIGARLLRNVGIKRAIDKVLTKITDANTLTAARVLKEIERLAMVNLADALDERGDLKSVKEMSEDVQRALSSVETRILRRGGILKKLRIFDKNRSLEMLAKHFKLLNEMAAPPSPNIQVILTLPKNSRESA